MSKAILESHVEENALDILKNLGYTVIKGDNENYLPSGNLELRSDYGEVILVDRLRDELKRINPLLHMEATEQAIKQLLRSQSQKLIADNEIFHKMLVDGIDVPISTKDGESFRKVWLFDFEHPEENDFLAVNQFTVIEN